MSENIPLLDNVRVAAPCPANWNEMAGGERVRYCRSCEKNVYNLSEMSRDEAETLLQTHEGRLCIRYYQRADGKILTQNCPVGLRTLRRAYLKVNAKVVALVTAIFGVSAIVLLPAFHSTMGERIRPESLRTAIKDHEEKISKAQHQLQDRKHPVSGIKRVLLQEEIQKEKDRIALCRKHLQAIGREEIERKMRE